MNFDTADVLRYDPQTRATAPLRAGRAREDEDEGEEAPASAPFGRWLWPSRREGVEATEPENAAEQAMFEALRLHFRTAHVGLSAEDVAVLVGILEDGEGKWYPRVLHPPPNKTLYRGIRLSSRGALAEFLGVPVDDVEDEGALDIGRSVSLINGFSTSWSARKKIAEGDFAARGKRGWAVTLILDVATNPHRLLAGPGGLYDVDGLCKFHKEKETVGLEPLTVRRVEWERYNEAADAEGKAFVMQQRAAYWGLSAFAPRAGDPDQPREDDGKWTDGGGGGSGEKKGGNKGTSSGGKRDTAATSKAVTRAAGKAEKQAARVETARAKEEAARAYVEEAAKKEDAASTAAEDAENDAEEAESEVGDSDDPDDDRGPEEKLAAHEKAKAARTQAKKANAAASHAAKALQRAEDRAEQAEEAREDAEAEHEAALSEHAAAQDEHEAAGFERLSPAERLEKVEARSTAAWKEAAAASKAEKDAYAAEDKGKAEAKAERDAVWNDYAKATREAERIYRKAEDGPDGEDAYDRSVRISDEATKIRDDAEKAIDRRVTALGRKSWRAAEAAERANDRVKFWQAEEAAAQGEIDGDGDGKVNEDAE